MGVAPSVDYQLEFKTALRDSPSARRNHSDPPIPLPSFCADDPAGEGCAVRHQGTLCAWRGVRRAASTGAMRSRGGSSLDGGGLLLAADPRRAEPCEPLGRAG